MYNEKGRGFLLSLLISFYRNLSVTSVTVEVGDCEESIVLILTFGHGCTKWRTSVADEWILDHAVAGLEANLGLEGIRIDCTNHLEWNVWAVEETSVVGACASIANADEVLGCAAVGVDVNAHLTS